MIHLWKRLIATFGGDCIAKSDLGWRIERFRRGLIVRPPPSQWAYVRPLVPFAINVAVLPVCYFAHFEKLASTILALPFSLFIGIYMFREAALCVNNPRSTVMLGNFRRLQFLQIVFEARHSGRWSVWLISAKLQRPVMVWESSDAASAKRICAVLTSAVIPRAGSHKRED